MPEASSSLLLPLPVSTSQAELRKAGNGLTEEELEDVEPWASPAGSTLNFTRLPGVVARSQRGELETAA